MPQCRLRALVAAVQAGFLPHLAVGASVVPRAERVIPVTCESSTATVAKRVARRLVRWCRAVSRCSGHLLVHTSHAAPGLVAPCRALLRARPLLLGLGQAAVGRSPRPGVGDEHAVRVLVGQGLWAGGEDLDAGVDAHSAAGLLSARRPVGDGEGVRPPRRCCTPYGLRAAKSATGPLPARSHRPGPAPPESASRRLPSPLRGKALGGRTGGLPLGVRRVAPTRARSVLEVLAAPEPADARRLAEAHDKAAAVLGAPTSRQRPGPCATSASRRTRSS